MPNVGALTPIRWLALHLLPAFSMHRNRKYISDVTSKVLPVVCTCFVTTWLASLSDERSAWALEVLGVDGIDDDLPLRPGASGANSVTGCPDGV